MRLTVHPAPDQPSVQALTYGRVVLAGAYGTDASTAPRLDTTSVRRTGQHRGPVPLARARPGAPPGRRPGPGPVT
jgi:hypothetical protein